MSDNQPKNMGEAALALPAQGNAQNKNNAKNDKLALALRRNLQRRKQAQKAPTDMSA